MKTSIVQKTQSNITSRTFHYLGSIISLRQPVMHLTTSFMYHSLLVNGSMHDLFCTGAHLSTGQVPCLIKLHFSLEELQ